MRLSPDELFMGVHPKIIKDCACQLHHRDTFSSEDFCEALGAPEDEATPVLRSLLKQDFIKRKKTNLYISTSKFSQLALASISAGLSRAKAEMLLTEVIERAKHINSSAGEFRDNVITKIVVFGSFLGDAALLGDLDIGVETERDVSRIKDKCTLEQSSRIYYKTLAFLKGRRRGISLHMLSEVMSLKTPFKTVFSDPLKETSALASDLHLQS